MHKHRCPCRAFISAGLIRLRPCCSSESHGVIRCFSVCKERVNNGCTIRSCCSSIRVLPGFPCVGVGLILGVGDRPSVRSGTSAGGISWPGPRLDHCVRDRLAVRSILRKTCECGFPCFRFTFIIDCTVKGHGLGSCCIVRIKCKRHFCIGWCFCRAICIFPFFGCADLCRHLCVRDRFATGNRIRSTGGISHLCSRLRYGVNDINRFTVYNLGLGEVHERRHPGFALVSSGLYRNCGLCRTIKLYRVTCLIRVGVKCERHFCAGRCCCSTIRVLPLFLCIRLCGVLCVRDGGSACNSIFCTGGISRPGCGLCHGVDDRCLSVCLIFCEAGERRCPGYRFPVGICCSVKGNGLCCGNIICVQSKHHTGTGRRGRRSVRILPCL